MFACTCHRYLMIVNCYFNDRELLLMSHEGRLNLNICDQKKPQRKIERKKERKRNHLLVPIGEDFILVTNTSVKGLQLRIVTLVLKSHVVEWLGLASHGHNIYSHDLKVMVYGFKLLSGRTCVSSTFVYVLLEPQIT